MNSVSWAPWCTYSQERLWAHPAKIGLMKGRNYSVPVKHYCSINTAWAPPWGKVRAPWQRWYGPWGGENYRPRRWRRYDTKRGHGATRIEYETLHLTATRRASCSPDRWRRMSTSRWFGERRSLMNYLRMGLITANENSDDFLEWFLVSGAAEIWFY